VKTLLVVLLLFVLASCGGGSSSATPKTIVVYGDSLCRTVPPDIIGWPSLVTGYEVENRCFAGYSLTNHYPDVSQDDFGYTVIALGVNDAGLGVDPDTFELTYRQLYDSVKNPICFAPPLTDRPEVQQLVIQYRDRLKSFCKYYIEGVPSDHPDGVHYTRAADELNAYNFNELMQNVYTK